MGIRFLFFHTKVKTATIPLTHTLKKSKKIPLNFMILGYKNY